MDRQDVEKKGKNKELNTTEQIDLYIESNEIKNKEAIEYIKDAITGIEKNKETITK